MNVLGQNYWSDLFLINRISVEDADELDCFSIASLVVADQRYRFQMRGVRGNEVMLGGLNFHVWAQLDTERGLLIADGATPFGDQRRIIEFLPRIPKELLKLYIEGHEVDFSFFNNIQGMHYQGEFSRVWEEYLKERN